MMPSRCCIQHVSKCERPGSGHRSGKVQSSSQFPRRVVLKNVLTIGLRKGIGFRKGRGIRDQIASIHWIIEKAREFQKNDYLCFIDYAKAFDYMDHNKLENSYRDGNIRLPYLSPEKPICGSRSNS